MVEAAGVEPAADAIATGVFGELPNVYRINDLSGGFYEGKLPEGMERATEAYGVSGIQSRLPCAWRGWWWVDQSSYGYVTLGFVHLSC